MLNYFCVDYVFNFLKKCKNLTLKELIKYIVGLLVSITLISVNLIPLIRGGIFLIAEKEEDAIKIEGVIEELHELSSFGGYKYNFEQNNGESIVLNGVKYYLMTYDKLQVGDNVLIRVLPKSRLILEIRRQ